MNSTKTFKWSLFLAMLLSFDALVSAHSQMRCAKYDKATGTCSAPIRNQNFAFIQESYVFNNGAPICQFPMSNPISASYSNGPACADWAGGCPLPMGTYTPGETFTVMWWARNHAAADQSPDTVFLYLSPTESMTQGADVSQSVMESRKICQGPYMNCNGQNGNEVPCTLTCTMPTNLAKGVYTMWWKWVWQNGVTYATCADIQVNVGGNTPSPSPPPAAITTAKAPVTTGRSVAVTTGRASVVTTGRTQQLTTGARVQTGRVTTSRTVTPTPPPSAPPASSSSGTASGTGSTGASDGKRCNYGEMRCTSTNTYQSCGYSQDGLNDWAATQACGANLVCEARAPYVYCSRP